MAKPMGVERPESEPGPESCQPEPVTGELSASGDPGTAETPAGGETQAAPPREPAKRNGRIELAFTISITVVALAGAVIAWRAEAAAQAAERYEQAALVAKATASGESHFASASAQGQADKFRRWLTHTQAAKADLQAKRAATGNPRLVAQLDHDAAIEQALANLYVDEFQLAYVNQDHYDVAKSVSDIQLLRSEVVDTAYQGHIDQAEEKRDLEKELSKVGLMLLIGLTLLTLGHLQHRTDLLLLLSLPAGVLSGIAILWAAKILFG